jgi:ACS family tartrate transporter-like MFS transporter
MPSTFLTGTSAAGAIALINSVGNLGGYLGPFMVGWGKDVTGRFNAGLYFLAGMILLGAVITFFAAPAETRREEPALALPEPAVSGGGR